MTAEKSDNKEQRLPPEVGEVVIIRNSSYKTPKFVKATIVKHIDTRMIEVQMGQQWRIENTYSSIETNEYSS